MGQSLKLDGCMLQVIFAQACIPYTGLFGTLEVRLLVKAATAVLPVDPSAREPGLILKPAGCTLLTLLNLRFAQSNEMDSRCCLICH